jgi:hypothetical protein
MLTWVTALDQVQVRKVILLAIAVITILHRLRRSLRLKNILLFLSREKGASCAGVPGIMKDYILWQFNQVQ